MTEADFILFMEHLRTWSVSPVGRPMRVPSVDEGPQGRWLLVEVTGLLLGSGSHPREANVEMIGFCLLIRVKELVDYRGHLRP